MILKKPRARCAAPCPGLLPCIIESVGAATGRPLFMLLRWIVRTKIFFLVAYNTCHCEPVVLRAANQNDNDCQWQSYLNAAQTGVAIPRFFENRRWSAEHHPLHKGAGVLPHQCDTTMACCDMRCLLLLKKRNDTELVPNGLPIIAQPTHALSAATRRRLSDESPGRTEPECPGRNESRSPPPHS